MICCLELVKWRDCVVMRPMCSGCARPLSVCLCNVIPSPPFTLLTRLLILQHPHELKHKLATVPMLSRCLHPCHVIVSRRLNSSNWPFAPFDDKSEEGRQYTLLLFPSPHATEIKLWFEAFRDQEEAEGAASALDGESLHQLPEVIGNGRVQYEHKCRAAGLSNEEIKLEGPLPGYDSQRYSVATAQSTRSQITLVVVDGSWEHAQEMVKASLPFLSKSIVQVCLPFDTCSEGYGMGESDLIIRKEPFGGCVSTLEAVARALAVLEPCGHIIEEILMDVLRKMVSLQAAHIDAPKIRPKLKKKSTKATTNSQLL